MAFKMKNAALKKQADMAGCPRTAAKMKAESTMKMKSPMEMKKSPMEKELVGKQGNLPPELKAKIEAAPSKMRNRKGAMETEAPLKMKNMPDAPRGRGKGGSTSYDAMKPGDLTPEQKKEKRAKELRDTYKPNKEVGSGKGLKPFDPKSVAKGKRGKNRKGEPTSPMTMKGEPMKMSHKSAAKLKKNDSPVKKTYKQAYDGLSEAQKKKYDGYSDFLKQAKSYNQKKYGTAEPTKKGKQFDMSRAEMEEIAKPKKVIARKTGESTPRPMPKAEVRKPSQADQVTAAKREGGRSARKIAAAERKMEKAAGDTSARGDRKRRKAAKKMKKAGIA